MKKVIIFFVLFLFAGFSYSQSPVFDHSININQTVTTSTEIFPFSNQSITSIGIKGNLTLYSDTSLVRVILKDSLTFEYMIFESYPMLDTIWSFNFYDECEETCFMDGFTPTSILINVKDASIYLEKIVWSSAPVSNPVSFQLSAKQNKVSEKLDKIQAYIQREYLIWKANHTYYSDLFYFEKLATGSMCLNFPGAEFYEDGIFAIKRPSLESKDNYINYDYVASFDWRNRHGANDQESNYYDGDPDGGGWITDFSECQSGCFVDGTIDCSIAPGNCPDFVNNWKSTALCWAFGPTAHIESLINLYLNYHVDINLSEQNLASCKYSSPTTGGGSTNGGYIFYDTEGVVSEEDFQFAALPLACSIPDITEHVFIDNYEYYNNNSLTEQEVRQNVMEHGPIGISRYYLGPVEKGHAMQMVGWDVVEWEDFGTFIAGVPGNELFYAPWVGLTYWIYKDSNGSWNWHNGFFYAHHYNEQAPKKVYVVNTDNDGFVYSGLTPPTFDYQNIVVEDNDLDGYCNWGIGPKPDGYPECPDEIDADDNNPGLGPMDEFGFCTIIDTYNSGFEISMDYWKQVDYDDCNWVKYYEDSFDYPYSGPNGTPDGSNNYLVMAEGHCYQIEHAYIESPPIDLTQHCRIDMDFAYHKNHHTIGFDFSSLSVDISYDDGQTWQNDYWKIEGDQDDVWYYETISLPSDITKLRFHGYFDDANFNYVFHHDMAIDDITIGPGSTDDIIITGNKIWDNQNYEICQNIIIEPNASLSFAEGTTVSLNDGNKIIVKRGALLTIDSSAVLTSSGDQLWQGIEVWGNKYQGQNYADQGVVEVLNGGTIENAICGISTIKMVDNTLPPPADDIPNYNYTGGMVLCDGAIFKNNRTAVKFWPYNHSTSASLFRYCQFITNDDMITGTGPETFIKITDISGIIVGGCSFTDSHTVTEVDELTTGIETYSSEFKVWAIGGASVFSGLYYGIKAYTVNPAKTADVISAHFIDNYRSVYLGGIDGAKVTGNIFEINAPYTTDGGYGLYLDESTDYWVEDNTFEKCSSCVNQTGVGIIVNESGGDPNEIYLNEFNEVENAINVQGNNRNYPNGNIGLVIKCNEYYNTKFDETIIWQEPRMSNTAGIAGHQGKAESTLIEDMAGNIFHYETSTTDYDDLDNEANPFNYYYSNNAGIAKVEPKDAQFNVTVYAIPIFTDPWSHEAACEPTGSGGGGGIGGDLGKMSSAQSEIETIEAILTALVDGGDTEALNTEVETSTPPETVDVYNELMAGSPNLSETVVESTIEKETVLPNAMVRDVMVANPHTAKSLVLLEKLDERFDPMPEYMKAQILAGRSIQTLKQELEGQLAGHTADKAKAMNSIVRYYRDNLEPQVASDSLLALYQSDNTIKSSYSLAWLYFERGEYQSGENVMGNIPNQYSLNENEQEQYTNMATVYTMLSGLYNNGNTIDSLSANQKTELQNLAAEGTIPARAYARNILLLLGEVEYEEPILFPDPFKSAEAIEEYNELMQAKAPQLLNVYPNPSTGYVILEYKLELEAEASIEVTDLNGRLVQTLTTTGIQDQLTLVTKGWKPGVYIASLKVDGKTTESVKFTLVK